MFREKKRPGTISSKTKSLLNWGDEFEIKRYGWNHMFGINVCFIDEIETKSKLSLCIEPSRFGFDKFCRSLASECASGFFFTKNEKTGKIDLNHCFRKPYHTEIRTVYHNCTYFGHATILNQKREESVFELTCDHRDLQFSLDLDLKLCSNYKEIVDSVNRLIHTALVCIDESPLVSPLCTVLDNYDGLGSRLLHGIDSSTSILDIYPPYCIDSVDRIQCACGISFSFDYAIHYPSPCHVDSTMIEVQSISEKEKGPNGVTAHIIEDEPIIVIARYSFVRFSDIRIVS
jgi:hypothetical protein